MIALGNYYSMYIGRMLFGSYLDFIIALTFLSQLMDDSPIGMDYYLPQIIIVLFWGRCFYWLYRLVRAISVKALFKFRGSDGNAH